MQVSNASQHPVFAGVIRVFGVLQRLYMRIFWYVDPVKRCTTLFGSTINCDARDFVQRRIRFFGIFEHNLTHYTVKRLRAGDLYVDIGANIG